MPSWSVEAIITLITLLATCLPLCLALGAWMKQKRASSQKNQGRMQALRHKVNLMPIPRRRDGHSPLSATGYRSRKRCDTYAAKRLQ
jgi:hypothetical protein